MTPKNPSIRPSAKASAQLLLLLASLGSTGHAAEIFKANNIDDMTSPSSWTGSVLPGASDIAVFDSRIVDVPLDSSTNLRYMPLGASQVWGGIKIVGNGPQLALDTFFGGGSAVTLTLGSAGIDASAATAGNTFTFENPALVIPAGTTQTWSVADAAALHFKGPLTRGTGSSLNFNLGASNNGMIVVDDPSFGTSGAITARSIVNRNDFAAVTTNASSLRVITSGSALNLYQANPAPDATNVLPTPGTGSGALMDFTATTTSDGSLPLQGITVPNGWFFQGFRFNVPNARTDASQWTVNFTGNRTITPSVGVVVGPGVGTDNVVFSGAGWFRIDNTNLLHIAQNNTQGDLIFSNSGGINARTAASAAVIKSGPGRLIMAAPIDANNGLYINEGTVQFGNGGTAGRPGTGVIVNNGALAVNRSDAISITGNISGVGTLTKTGAGVLTLSGNNTYTGATTINGGGIHLGHASALGATPSITLNNGGITYGTGVTTDISSVPVALAGGNVTINTNGNNVTFAQSIGQNGSGSLIKTGNGTLTLGAANTYTGSTSVNGGTLAVNNVSGSATGSGALNLSGGASLTGSGTISGAVTAGTGTTLVPGNGGVGTLTVGGLSLAAGSFADFEFGSTSSYDRIVSTGSNGLTINGGGLRLYSAGGTTPFSTPGTYNLFQFSGAVQGTGPNALSVLNPQAGYAYTFGTSGSFVTLLVELDAILSKWNITGSGSWGSGANWSNGAPTSGYTAQFTTELAAPATVTLDGNRTVNGMVFTSVNGYTIAPGTGGTLSLDKGAKNAAVNVTSGQHTISAPVALASNIAASTDAGASLTISGAISGSGGITKTGAGTLDLTGNNSFTGNVNVTAGVLGFGQATSLGAGTLTLNGGTLRYDTGNTADISAKTIVFGQEGATIDTNGNDVIWMNPVGNGGAGVLTKVGAGILALDGINTYSGGTVVTGGTVRVGSDAGLGVAGSQLTLNGGKLSAGTLSLLTDTTNRPVAVGASGGAIIVDANSTLTVPGVISGAGVLSKEGAGTLLLNTPAATITGGVNVAAGTLLVDLPDGKAQISNTIVNVTSASAVGGGPIAFSGGTFNTTVTDNNSMSMSNAISVAAGQSGTLVVPNRFSLTGAVSGAGNLTIRVKSNATRTDFANSFASFNGTLNFANGTASGTAATNIRLLANNTPAFNNASFAAAKVNLGTGVGFTTRTNSTGNTIQIGELNGGAGGTLTNEAGGAATYQIGALNTNSVYAGNIVPGNNSSNHITKVGTGSLTLTGSNTSTGNYTINAGSLVWRGQTTTVPAVTVAEGASFGGDGSLASVLTINGSLRPDSTGNFGGYLTLTDNATITYGGNATTVIDFNAANFTGVKSTAATPYAYGGALKFNFLGTVFNGSYKVFDLAVAPTGAFTGVSVTTTTATETPLSGAGSVWSGTVGAQSYSFDVGTGVLTVTGGATAVTPGASVLSATAGDAKVDLSWTAAANGNTYTVKRSTTQGGPYANVVSGLTATSYSDTSVTNGTTYYYVVQAKNTTSNLSGANSNEVSASPQLSVTYTALQSWRFEQFGVYDDDATVLAGDAEDFDGDGLANLLEYAVGTNPKVANASPVTVAKSGNFLTLTYPRRSPADAALTYTVQGSNDLGTAFAAGTGATVTTGSTSVYTDNVDLSATGARRFLRLSVSYTTP